MSLRISALVPVLFLSSLAFAAEPAPVVAAAPTTTTPAPSPDPLPAPKTPTDTSPTMTTTPATTAPTVATGTTVRPTFVELDVNKDSSIDKTEATKNSTLSTNFEKLDGDKNGKLTSVEYAGWK